MSLILAATGVLVGLAVLAGLGVVARQLWQRWSAQRFVRQSQAVQAALREVRERGYDGLDKMLFDMRDQYDPRVIEEELRVALDEAGGAPPPRLVAAFRALGLTERYLARVRGAPSWQERARAAHTLGGLGEPASVRPMLDAMRDAREDDDVKLACAEALALIRDPAIVAPLCEELEHVDEWSSPRIAQVLVGFGALAVEPLLTALDQARTLNARMWAAQVLGKLGDRRAVPALLARLHDRDAQLRLSVASALGDLADGRAARPLIEIVLRDPVPAVRAQAAIALGHIGDPASLPLLVSALGDPEYWVRFRALEAIEELAPEDAAPIEAALRDANREVRHRAALAIERLGRLDAVFDDLVSDEPLRAQAARERLVLVGRAGLSERLARHLSDPIPVMRARIATLLGAVGSPAHADALLGALDDADEAVRLAVIEALGDLGRPDTAAVLVDRLPTARAAEREAQVGALVRYPAGALAAVGGKLSALLGEESDDVRAAAARVLAAVPGDASGEALRLALTDRYVGVRLEAVRALGTRNDAAAVDAIGPSLSDAYEPLRVAAADALGQIGGDRAIALLLTALPGANPEQRDSICDTLARFGFGAIRPALDVLLATDDVKARLGAVWTLGKTRDPRAVPLLALLLQEPDREVRSSAAGALGKIEDSSALAALVTALHDPNPFVRSATVNALGAIASADEVPVLVPMLDDPNDFVRGRAALAIGRLGGDAACAALLGSRPVATDPALHAVALGLTGTPAGVAEAVRLLDDGAVRAAANELLRKEARPLRARFFEHLRIDDRDGAELSVDVDVARLAPTYAATLRNSPDVQARRIAATVLAGISDDRATEALADAVRHDPDRDVRTRAVAGLAGRVARLLARQTLLGAILDPHPPVRVAAIDALVPVLTPADAAPLFGALRAVDAEVVTAAEAALARVFTDHLLDLHDWMMAQEDVALLAAGLRVVARIADARSVGLVAVLARSPAPAVRIAAVRALGALATPRALDALLEGLGDPVAEVRVAVVRALRGTSRAELVARLGEARLDPSAEVRAALADCLATVAAGGALDLLAELATDAAPAVAAAALHGLATSVDADGVARFLDAWPRAADPARWLLRDGGDAASARLAAIAADALEPARREAAVRGLGAVGAGPNAERIARALEDPHPAVRLAAVEALATLDLDRVADWLRRVIDDPVPAVRTAARRRLMRAM